MFHVLEFSFNFHITTFSDFSCSRLTRFCCLALMAAYLMLLDANAVRCISNVDIFISKKKTPLKCHLKFKVLDEKSALPVSKNK